MNEIELLRQLNRRTRAPAPAAIDVTADVLATLRRGEETRFAMPVLLTVAATACSIAIALCLLAQQAFAATQDPLGSLLAPFFVGF